ncbi:tetrafunctional fatty acid synthase subunit [Saccharomycopsis crataegensis]|uniref:Fatty acid synthase subunit beta n=1 Tax=Saccharomycopsis crataegensis TaxID=43959 RepID=A0AAV5QXV4_9ASCO|nr:tetrafunctional fatty acid synthase subunit [Saccharomycopsis crataegensis]
MSSPSIRPFDLTHGSIETSFLIPTTAYFSATQLKEQFIKSLPQATENFADENEPSTSAELLGKFLGFAADLVDPNVTGLFDDVLKLAVNEFETNYLNNSSKDIHSLATDLLADPENSTTTLPKVKNLVKNYIKAKYILNSPFRKSVSALYQNDKVKMVAIFGGQGRNDYFEELKEIYDIYHPLIADLVKTISEKLNNLLSITPNSKNSFSEGFDLLGWLNNPDSIPDEDYLLSANVSCPLICVIQILHFAITAKILGLTPGELKDHFKGSTGHSQGVVTAIAISASTSWTSFIENSLKAISALFFIGLRCSEVYPNYSLPPSIFQDSIENNEGKPSPMLSIRDLSRKQVEEFIAATNSHLPADKHVVVSLVNGARNLVVSGPPQSLYGLNLALRKAKAPSGLEQSRIPHSERKLQFSNRFLSITTPFHSHLLDNANKLILEDMKKNNIDFLSSDLKIPVIDTYTGDDLREIQGSVMERAIYLITNLPVHWEAACDKIKATHILDFGPGGASGIGALTHYNKEGTGVRIIVAGTLDINPEDEFGYKQEMFDNDLNKVKFASNWLSEFQPSLVKNSKTGELYLNTKFSKLLGRAPLMVPGMTPSTVDTGFVSATLNAGYHIEIAGGGYFRPAAFEKALRTVAENVKPGTGIGINLIYVNPRMLQWGIPLIKKLRDQNFPIQSLTIGAGVPSLEVATEYIETLGLTYLGLKPGSIDAINQVIAIAKAHPTFPIVLQWTGGRGGGHHSFEDFHQPMLSTYSSIRRCSNIVLVAGSGFGSSEDTYPYLTGAWSKKFNYPAMPFDGFLFGSRVMIAKETMLSVEGKELIASAPGVPDEKWEGTYKKATGGIITVRSEMGEPIHKIATRGVQLWAEIDKDYFTIKPKEMVKKLAANKDKIIEKLNKDFQRPWFGKNSKGPCDVKEMTYSEVSARLLEFFYYEPTKEWIDPSLRTFMFNWLSRIEERFITKEGESILSVSELSASPKKVLAKVDAAFPDSLKQLVNAYDVIQFMKLCANPAQKPVPFIPALDERFETYFKKDSLFQCQNLNFVPDRDIQRTCILHGPVAAQYTNKVNEPIKDLMDSINNGLIEKLLADSYNGDKSTVPSEEYFGGLEASEVVQSSDVSSDLKVEVSTDKVVYKFGESVANVDNNKWIKLLAGSTKNWRYAFLTSKFFVAGVDYVDNQFQSLIEPFANAIVEIEHPNVPSKTVLRLLDGKTSKPQKLIEVKLLADGKTIELLLFTARCHDDELLPLQLLYTYNTEDGFAPILEKMDDRNERIKEFYWKLWFGKEDKYDDTFDLRSQIYGANFTITAKDVKKFAHIIKNKNDYCNTHAPMDFAIVIGWERIMKSVFHKKIDGDLLKLVHLSNSFSVRSNAEPLKIGDVVGVKSEVLTIINTPTGKQVKVLGTIFRVDADGKEQAPVLDVESQFFYRGQYDDFENTFDKIIEKPVKVKFASLKDVAVLKSKDWAHFEDESLDILGETLTFELETDVTFKDQKVFSSVKSTGKILLELPTKEIKQVGTVDYEAAESYGNPVLDYLKRNGTSIEETKLFESPISMAAAESINSVYLPGSNDPYAVVSGDYNPIHISPIFAKYAQLPGTITHGMYTSASVRALLELWGADNVAERVKAYKANFTAMVLPGTELTTELEHIGMINGRKIVKISTKNAETGELVLDAQAEVAQPVSTYLFTGQGSQEQNMGMDLYKTSDVAKEVWDRADYHLMEQYGFSILDIVRNNPKEFTVHFGGVKGRAIRSNYTSMIFETIDAAGNLKSEKIFKDITEKTKSYTFKSPNGLLSATQFTQPALTLMEKAAFEDLKSKGLVTDNCVFAGHSLGEYSALTSLGDVMPIESLVEVVFYRGMTMQVAVERDEQGRSNYGMIACNPSRVSKTFDDAALRFVVDAVAKKTGWLLEIVNYNVENQQYVAAGDLRALDSLTNVLNVFKLKKIDIVKLQEQLSVEKITEYLDDITEEVSKQSLAKPQPIDLQRGFACIPLKGISVPFHSSYLKGGVQPFKKFLLKKIPQKALNVDNLVNKYIPNLTAKPFEVTKEYFEDVYQLTGSETIKRVIDNWESYQN